MGGANKSKNPYFVGIGKNHIKGKRKFDLPKPYYVE